MYQSLTAYDMTIHNNQERIMSVDYTPQCIRSTVGLILQNALKLSGAQIHAVTLAGRLNFVQWHLTHLCPRMELASCHDSDTEDCEIPPTFFGTSVHHCLEQQ